MSIGLLGTYPDERPLCRRQLARIVALALRLLIKLRASLSVHCSPALPHPTPPPPCAQAGGAGSTGFQRVLDIVPTKVSGLLVAKLTSLQLTGLSNWLG